MNGKPLAGKGIYEARIACNLYSAEGAGRYGVARKAWNRYPYFTQEYAPDSAEALQYIANMQNRSTAGFKYFDLLDVKKIAVRVRGEGSGVLQVLTDAKCKETAARIVIPAAGEEARYKAEFHSDNGIYPLYFVYKGTESIDFKGFKLSCWIRTVGKTKRHTGIAEGA